MNAAFAFCAMVMIGSETPEFMEPIAPLPENPPQQLSGPQLTSPQSIGTRTARVVNERMPGSNRITTETAEFLEPISPLPEYPRQQLSGPHLTSPQSTGTRTAWAVNERISGSNRITTNQQISTHAARPANEGVMRSRRMPVAPTDPNAFFRDDLPLPPTMNHSGALPSSGMAGAGQRLTAAAVAENSHRLSNQKPFDHYAVAPTTSPYALLAQAPTTARSIPTRPTSGRQRTSNRRISNTTARITCRMRPINLHLLTRRSS